jgi:hypothetical protein
MAVARVKALERRPALYLIVDMLKLKWYKNGGFYGKR